MSGEEYLYSLSSRGDLIMFSTTSMSIMAASCPSEWAWPHVAKPIKNANILSCKQRLLQGKSFQDAFSQSIDSIGR